MQFVCSYLNVRPKILQYVLVLTVIKNMFSTNFTSCRDICNTSGSPQSSKSIWYELTSSILPFCPTDSKLTQKCSSLKIKTCYFPLSAAYIFLEKRGATSHSPQLSPIDSELMPKFYHLLCEQVGNSDIKI